MSTRRELEFELQKIMRLNRGLKKKTQDVQSQQRQEKGIGEANTGSP